MGDAILTIKKALSNLARFELIPSESLWQVAVTVLIFLVFALISVTLIAILKHLQNNRINKTMTLLQPLFDKFIKEGIEGRFDESAIAATIEKRYYGYFERYLRNRIALMDELDVAVEQRLSKISGFTEWNRRLAVTAKGWRKANALRTLSYLRNRDDIEIFRNALKSNFFQSRYAASIGLALNYDSESIPLIIKALSTKEQPHRDVLLTVLFPLAHCSGPIIVDLLMDKNLYEPVQCVLIDILREADYRPAFSVLQEKLFESTDNEVIIHLIEAIGVLGKEGEGDFLRKWLQHENSAIRIKAITALGRLQGEAALPVIEKYMEDKFWWARRAAAESLYRMGGEGLVRLKTFGEGKGTFASDVARLILFEAEFGRLKGEPSHA